MTTFNSNFEQEVTEFLNGQLCYVQYEEKLVADTATAIKTRMFFNPVMNDNDDELEQTPWIFDKFWIDGINKKFNLGKVLEYKGFKDLANKDCWPFECECCSDHIERPDMDETVKYVPTTWKEVKDEVMVCPNCGTHMKPVEYEETEVMLMVIMEKGVINYLHYGRGAHIEFMLHPENMDVEEYDEYYENMFLEKYDF